MTLFEKTIFKKKIRLEVLAISLATQEDRVKLGITDTRIPTFRVGMQVESGDRDFKHFSFLPSHITTILSEHPCIGDRYTLTFEKENL